MSIAAGVYRGTLCANATAIAGYLGVAYPQLYEQLHWLQDAVDRPPPSAAVVGTLLIVELVNYYCTFLWTFMDVFIVAISLCLRLGFGRLNEFLERHRGRVWAAEGTLNCTTVQRFCADGGAGNAAAVLGGAATLLQQPVAVGRAGGRRDCRYHHVLGVQQHVLHSDPVAALVSVRSTGQRRNGFRG